MAGSRNNSCQRYCLLLGLSLLPSNKLNHKTSKIKGVNMANSININANITDVKVIKGKKGNFLSFTIGLEIVGSHIRIRMIGGKTNGRWWAMPAKDYTGRDGRMVKAINGDLEALLMAAKSCLTSAPKPPASPPPAEEECKCPPWEECKCKNRKEVPRELS